MIGNEGGRARGSTEETGDGAERARAIGVLIWRDPERILASASRLRGSDAEIECRLRGASMGTAIPAGSRLRIRLGAAASPEPGDVVALIHDSLLCVHRVVHRGRTGRARDHLVTQGDACLCPDPPVRLDRVLGHVTAIHCADGWVPTPARAPGARARSPVSVALQAATSVLLAVDPRVAEFVARLAASVAGVLPQREPAGGYPLRFGKRDARRDPG